MEPIEIQPYSSFNAMGIAPNTLSDLRLSGGRTIPYIYQLAVNATVPFIQLIGSAIAQKLLSWNEKIIVPPGQMVTVKNASFHRGDIWISSGWDPGVRPSRVTVPFTITDIDPGEGFLAAPDFPLDTRRALRAFVGGLPAPPVAATFINRGVAKLRSHPVDATHTYLANPEAVYNNSIGVPPATLPGLLPLGDTPVAGDPVHTLLDEATFTYNVDFQTAGGGLYYVLEYR